ncbi:hypothetical protein GJ496_010371 [Pomphorhynchus laevis]|nr:hypothetical protein GJ496_010371 [Pomphorhynchus laevis]
MGILNIENLKFYIVLVNYCSGNGWIQLKMSPFIAKHSDQYACKSFKIDEPIYYIRRFVPKIDHSRVHHLLLFGCENKRFQSQDSVWDCDTHNFEAHRYRNIDSFTGPPCTGEGSILYAWTMNGTTFTLPDGIASLNSLLI